MIIDTIMYKEIIMIQGMRLQILQLILIFMDFVDI